MDNCKRQAWKQHPDYTREGNAKRDEAVRNCRGANNAPAGLAPYAAGKYRVVPTLSAVAIRP
jgi:hypothetical protein